MLIAGPEFNVPKNPAFLFIEVTTECNLRCRQCHLWMTEEDRTIALDTDKKVDLIKQFRDLNRHGTVVFTGGEPLLKPNEFFRLCDACHTAGLGCVTNTNGVFIDSPDKARTLLDHGPDSLILSLDSQKPELHDYMRGTAGTFERVINGIRYLVREKRTSRAYQERKLLINTIVSDLNYSDLPLFIQFCKDLGTDGIMFQMLSRTFGPLTDHDSAFEELFPKDKEAFKQMMDTLTQDYCQDSFVRVDPQDLSWMKKYIDNPDFIGEPVCDSYHRNLIIDMYGEAWLCFGMHALTRGESLGNVKTNRLNELWTSSKAREFRMMMEDCRKNCGMLHCHRKER